MDSEFRIHHVPPYALGAIQSAVLAARANGRDIIDLSQINPDLVPPAEGLEKLVQEVLRPHNHRYSASQGIFKLREAFAGLYRQAHQVELEIERQVVVTMGTKEALSHLLLATLSPGDNAIVLSPTYPIYPAAVSIAACGLVRLSLFTDDENPKTPIELNQNSDWFFERLEKLLDASWPKPKVMITNFPHNPCGISATSGFFERLVRCAKSHEFWIINDFSYAHMGFDGYAPQSILGVPGAQDVAVELFSLSKSFNIPGWRVGACLGAPELVEALKKLKSYVDFGIFQPLQLSAVSLLRDWQKITGETCGVYQRRRDVLVESLQDIGWSLKKPRAGAFVWSELPEPFVSLGAEVFAEKVLREIDLAVSPGTGFDPLAESFVRFSLGEREDRIRTAVKRLASFRVNGKKPLRAA